MDALLLFSAMLIGLIILDALAVTFGVDTRDDLRDDWAA
jgi:hypothetical protein